MNQSLIDRFWAKIDRSSADACWLWRGAISSSGYGTFGWYGFMCSSHRIAAFLAGLLKSPFWKPSRTEKTLVLHKCDNPLCCNPDHLFLGNFADNSRDCVSKGRTRTAIGADHHSAKLNNFLVEEIRHQFAHNDVSIQELARKHNVSNNAIGKVVYGESYKRIPGPIFTRPSKLAA